MVIYFFFLLKPKMYHFPDKNSLKDGKESCKISISSFTPKMYNFPAKNFNY